MREYKIELESEAHLIGSTDEKTSELGIVLQVYQDLHHLSSKGFLNVEDAVIKKVLEQILEIEFNGINEIPKPEYYKEEENSENG